MAEVNNTASITRAWARQLQLCGGVLACRTCQQGPSKMSSCRLAPGPPICPNSRHRLVLWACVCTSIANIKTQHTHARLSEHCASMLSMCCYAVHDVLDIHIVEGLKGAPAVVPQCCLDGLVHTGRHIFGLRKPESHPKIHYDTAAATIFHSVFPSCVSPRLTANAVPFFYAGKHSVDGGL